MANTFQINPTWDIAENSLVMATYQNMEEHEEEVLSSKGLGSWYKPDHDEILFSKSDDNLISLWLLIPEVNSGEIDLKPILATPVKKYDKSDNQLFISIASETSETRYYDSEHDTLICFYSSDTDVTSKIAIHESLCFLQSGNKLCGWLLTNATSYVSVLFDRSSYPVNSNDKLLLAKYIRLITIGNIDLMEENDSNTKKDIELLVIECKTIDSHISHLLQEQLLSIIDRFCLNQGSEKP